MFCITNYKYEEKFINCKLFHLTKKKLQIHYGCGYLSNLLDLRVCCVHYSLITSSRLYILFLVF